MGKRFLTVMSDDFGMCPAVNEGIVEAFTEGILTDTNLMAPCPAFEEAAILTKKYDIPVGLHATFTCDWDIFRWKPLTDLPSMITDDGHFKATVVDAWESAVEAEAVKELEAQYQACIDHGIQLNHVGEHMGVSPNGIFQRVMLHMATDFGLPHKGGWVRPGHNSNGYKIPRYDFKTNIGISSAPIDFEKTKQNLRATFENLEDGYHMWVVHCAKDDPSMDDLCSEDWGPRDWARPFRALDQAMVMDPEIADWLEELEIELVSITEVPVVDGY